MEKQRIQVYTDPETKRRIELAAMKHDMPVTAYCIEAIRKQLADDDLLSREQIEIAVSSQAPDSSLLTDMETLNAKILARRNGKHLEVDIVEQVRNERDEELTGLR